MPLTLDPAESAEGPLLTKVLDELGGEIVSGTMAPGERFTLQDLSDRFGISRTVAREAMRALEQLGLVSSSRRVGIKVLTEEHWAVFDQAVIRWRLSSEAHRAKQIVSLDQLRKAIEPVASALAATNATKEQAQELRSLAEQLMELSEAGQGNTDAFLEVDKRFHTLILECSGNEMFSTLALPILYVLEGRTRYGIMPNDPHLDAMAYHLKVAEAIQSGDSTGAENASWSLLRGVDGFVEF